MLEGRGKDEMRSGGHRRGDNIFQRDVTPLSDEIGARIMIGRGVCGVGAKG